MQFSNWRVICEPARFNHWHISPSEISTVILTSCTEGWQVLLLQNQRLLWKGLNQLWKEQWLKGCFNAFWLSQGKPESLWIQLLVCMHLKMWSHKEWKHMKENTYLNVKEELHVQIKTASVIFIESAKS